MPTHPTDCAAWLDYFLDNRDRENALPWESGVTLSPRHRDALVRTLQRFHLGESGEGQWLKRWAAQRGDALYCRTIELFVAEEQAHSRWFGRLLDALGAPKLRSHWSDAAFTRVRRLGGLHFELVTFLTAEIIGKHLFSCVARRGEDALIRAVFARIVKDESAHIAFHVATLRAAFGAQSRWQRTAWQLGWRVLLLLALLLVCLDHAALFKVLGVSRREFAARCWHSLRRVSGKIWREGAPQQTVATNALIWD